MKVKVYNAKGEYERSITLKPGTPLYDIFKNMEDDKKYGCDPKRNTVPHRKRRTR